MKRSLPILLLLTCSAGFAFGLLQLFRLRFAVGDVYPAYSSLRADPLGTMAFCESLGRMSGLSVWRDFKPVNELPEGKGTAYLHLAARTQDWTSLPQDLAREIDRFLLTGGRLVITFFPETTQRREPLFDEARPSSDKAPKKPSKSDGGKADKQKARDLEFRRLHQISLKTWWRVEFAHAALERGEGRSYEPARVANKSGLPLPDTLLWHSAVVFTNLDKAWRTIYARGPNPVVAERRFGSGTVVLATDSYFLSNEALRRDRHADLLAWLVGPVRQVVFDEAHFGIADTAGVASLIRKYRLHGLAAGLLVLAGLFVWQNSVSFAPLSQEETDPGNVAGQEVAAGFVNLLRRNVSPRDVLRACFEEWKKAFTAGARPAAAKIAQAQAVLEAESALPQRRRDPVRAYQEMSRILQARHSRVPKSP